MKRCLCIVLIILALSGCGRVSYKNSPDRETDTPFIKGVWISYSEINSMLKSGNFKGEFLKATENLSTLNITDLFVHVRAFGDSLFNSEYFSLNPLAEEYDFDILECMINTCHNKKMRFHAWINPYRTKDGTFLDPSDTNVQSNIIKGIKEILSGYSVDGIHFDDYFYPANSNDIDRESYAGYCESTPFPLTLEDFRTANITSLISSVYNAVKLYNSEIVFSISPSASIEKNKTEFFADVEDWCKNGYADLIIPQIYFGFDYPDEKYRFENLLEVWKSVKRAENVKLIIGLSAYKLGTAQEPDCKEWADGSDILKKQTELCIADRDIDGVSYFSFSHLFNEDELHKKSLVGLKNVIISQ